MPAGIRVVCLDDNATIELGIGGEGAGSYDMQGSADALTSVFSGNSVFGQDLLDGKVFARGSLQYSSVLTGRSIEWTLRGAS